MRSGRTRSREPTTRTARGLRRVVLCGLAAVLLPTSSSAHDRSTSYSTWDIRGRNAQVTVRFAQLDVSRFPWAATAGDELGRPLGEYLTRHVQLLADRTPCPVVEAPRAQPAIPGRFVYEWRITCPDTGRLSVRSDLFLDVAPSHLHFARVSRDGTGALERALSDGERTWELTDTDSTGTPPLRGTSLTGYVALGIEHIFTGYDHLAFLLALLLIGGTLGEVAKVVTGFTVAHSVTLALTVLGYVRPDTAPVEALIGLSIALVAAENMWLIGARGGGLPGLVTAILLLLALNAAAGHGCVPALTLAGLAVFSGCYFQLLRRASRTASLRWAIAFIFGLVHGFGFASVLGEAGLPPDRVVHALFGFNVGVEAGQLAVVSLLWPLLRVATWRDRERIGLALVEVGSAAVLALGVFWFVSRTYG